MKLKVINFVKFAFISILLVGCREVQENTFYISQTTDFGGAGNFMAINMATNDTLKVPSGIIIGWPILEAQNGNIIKLVFEPAKEYSAYKFSTTFTLHDNTELKDPKDYNYEYVINDTKEGHYTISMFASYKDDNNDIKGGGSFYLNVKK